MTREVIIKPDAEQDIDAAFVWYEKARDNLGFEFLLSLDAFFSPLVEIHFTRAIYIRMSEVLPFPGFLIK